MRSAYKHYLILPFAIILICGCSSKQTFSTAAPPGGTVTLPIGAYYELNRADLSATIQPCVGSWPTGIDQTTGNCIQPMGSPVVYNQGDSRIRAVANMRPDLISKLVIDRETSGEGFGTIGRLIENASLGKDKEYVQTFVMFDLPTSIPTGVASIALTSADNQSIHPVAVEVLSGTGSSDTFETYEFITNDNHLQAFERAPHYTVSFTKDAEIETPYAIQVDFIHNLTDQDLTNNGGEGVAFASNPRGDIKNLAWSDNGTSMRVIMTPAWVKQTIPGPGEAMSEMQHFKFYVAGGVTGFALAPPTPEIPNGFLAFDINGNEISSGIHISIQ